MSIQAFFAELGIELRGRGGDEAPVRCFAAGGEHRREDRRPSVSVNLTTGAWLCHGCGARGGPYDAALATGRRPREAMDLLRSFQLIDDGEPGRRQTSDPKSALVGPSNAPRSLAVGEADVRRWAACLRASPPAASRLLAARRFDPGTLTRLGVGWDRGRLTIPIRTATGQLQGLVRYTPWPHAGAPKALAVRGSTRDLFPAPEQLPPGRLVLCEGEPDALALLSGGVPATAVPGVGAWHRARPERFTGSSVVVVMDCDPPGRAAATRIEQALRAAGVAVEVVDLAPDRDDGFDVTDALQQDANAVIAKLGFQGTELVVVARLVVMRP